MLTACILLGQLVLDNPIDCRCNDCIEFEWPGPPCAGPLGHIELSSTSVDDPEMQLGEVDV